MSDEKFGCFKPSNYHQLKPKKQCNTKFVYCLGIPGSYHLSALHGKSLYNNFETKIYADAKRQNGAGL